MFTLEIGSTPAARHIQGIFDLGTVPLFHISSAIYKNHASPTRDMKRSFGTRFTGKLFRYEAKKNRFGAKPFRGETKTDWYNVKLFRLKTQISCFGAKRFYCVTIFSRFRPKLIRIGTVFFLFRVGTVSHRNHFFWFLRFGSAFASYAFHGSIPMLEFIMYNQIRS